MKLFICAAILLFLPSYGRAATDMNRACVLRATKALPKVAGLQVKRSGTRSMPPEQLANWKGQSKPMTVDIDTVARVSPNSIPTFAPAAQLARHLSSASFSEGQRNEPSAEYHLLFAERSDTALAGDGETDVEVVDLRAGGGDPSPG